MIKQEISVEYTISENPNYPADANLTSDCIRFIFSERDAVIDAAYDAVSYKVQIRAERLALPSELKFVVKGIDDIKDAEEIEGSIEAAVEALTDMYITELNKDD